MIRLFILFFIFFQLFSCQNKSVEETESPDTKDSTAFSKKFDMYELSEMSLLMEQMYVENQRLRDRIINGDSLGKFPVYFEKIHFATMTDDDDSDAFFKMHAEEFIQLQKVVHEDPDRAKINFNKAIQACITCHEVKCGGPIPKIKKLLIP